MISVIVGSDYRPGAASTNGDGSEAPLSDGRRFDANAWVLERLRRGAEADFDAERGATPSVAGDEGWDDRTLTASFIAELCTMQNPATALPRGIRIKGARIMGELDLATCTIGSLLLLERCRIEKGMMLRDCSAKLLNFAASRVCGDINADRLRSSAGVYLRDGFTCTGFVRLTAASIDGDLDCNRGTIDGAVDRDEMGVPIAGAEKFALRCDRARITGSVLLKSLVANSQVRLLDAKVGSNVVCEGATLTNSGKIALLADNARIDGSLTLRKWRVRPDGQLSVRNASAGVLQLGALDETWPTEQTVRAQGFRYTALETEGLVSLALCKRWLSLLARDPFSPQPYEKCAQVLREIGRTDDAKEVAILRRLHQRDAERMRGLRRWADVLLEKLIGYGYRPANSIIWLAVFALIGAVVFWQANRTGAMVPSESSVATAAARHGPLPPGYPVLNPFVYSLDVLLPIIDFQQDSKWRPDRNVTATCCFGDHALDVPMGAFARWAVWILIAVGWILSTLLVASLTGLIRKD